MSKNSCVAVFNTHEEAEQAIAELHHAGIDMKRLTVVGKGYERAEHVKGYYNAIDRVKFWGKRGAFWGGMWGIIFSPAFMFVPVAGSVTVGRILLSTFASGLSTAVFTGGLSAIGAALYSIGIPKNSVIKYEAAIKLEKYLLIFHGTRNEVERASDILGTLEDAEIVSHNA
jgi:uncharacterized membrane protein